MRRAILRGQLLAVLAALLVCALAAVFLLNGTMVRERTQSLQFMVQAGAALWDGEKDPQSQLQQLVGNQDTLRATLIAPDGTVLGDTWSDPAQMGNHLERPEVQAAFQGEGVTVARVSETLGQTMLYAAALTPDGSCLRLARESGDLVSAVTEMLPALSLIHI